MTRILTICRLLLGLASSNDAKHSAIAAQRRDQRDGQRKSRGRGYESQTQKRVTNGRRGGMVDQQLKQVVGRIADLVEQTLGQAENVVFEREGAPVLRNESRFFEKYAERGSIEVE